MTNKTTSPLVSPNITPKNLSKPDAPDHLMSLLINLISIPPTKIKITNTTMYERIFEISGLPIYSSIFGVAKNSKLIAAIKAAIHKKSDRNSFANPLEKDISPDAIRTTRINQSAKFNPKAST
jgi:hypothetical protein